MRYCGSLDLDHLLHQPFAHLGRLVRDEHSGQPLPPVEVAARAVLLRAAGYEVMPTCGSMTDVVFASATQTRSSGCKRRAYDPCATCAQPCAHAVANVHHDIQKQCDRVV